MRYEHKINTKRKKNIEKTGTKRASDNSNLDIFVVHVARWGH